MKRTTRTPRDSPRLSVALAHAGVASRRVCDAMIQAGRVTVDGEVVRVPATRVDPTRAAICVDGERIAAAAALRYWVVHKPRGVVSTTSDPEGRRTVLDLVEAEGRLYPVGRLDSASEGLLLVTNDGALAQRMLHPSFEVPRIYRVAIEGIIDDETMARLVVGVELDDGEVAVARAVRLLAAKSGRSRIEMVLTEGRRRQIRRMLEAVGHPVRRLVRVAFGPLRLGGLAAGTARPLRADEREMLAQLVRSGGRRDTARPSARRARAPRI